MTLAQRIGEIIRNLSEEDLDEMTVEDVKSLSDAQFAAYVTRAVKLGRKFFVDMVIDRDPPLGHWALRCGTFSSFVWKEAGMKEWNFAYGAGIIPGLDILGEPPVMVGEATFREKMKERGVDEDFVEGIVLGLKMRS